MSKKKKKEDEPKKQLTVPSLQSDRHGLISGFCKIVRYVFGISLDDFPHIATSLEKLRRKQLVTLLRAKIDEAACLGWVVIPFSSRDLNGPPGDLDL